MLPRAAILHSLPGRTRIALPAGKGDLVLIERVAVELRRFPEVVESVGNPVTGAILLHHSGLIEPICVRARQAGLFELGPPEVGRQGGGSVQERAAQGLRRLSNGLEAVSGGEVDLNGVLIVTFALLAIRQALQGQVMIPAATALWYALNASRQSPEEQRRGQDKAID